MKSVQYDEEILNKYIQQPISNNKNINRYLKYYENTKITYLQEDIQVFSQASSSNTVLAGLLGGLNLLGIIKLFQVVSNPIMLLKHPNLFIVSKVIYIYDLMNKLILAYKYDTSLIHIIQI
jgi:hypothetical protein